ncbi:mechanosensitive ion channel family protein [Paraburkholderia rhizosphaerae]|uniref:Mechanosensitive ion channel-like protein n=1 Tax=Paraburkholderia rhizosphaerae TaxID=480658 RepID=A0A4R8L442_9BURK|nr:mechanosensitive ion channel domain-containing protein [Paraburkholderia rhizosphaerae]TDY37263.1 mechanosensitive ion channel-like protein [Paraburkholderia rhizosphaerae]
MENSTYLEPLSDLLRDLGQRATLWQVAVLAGALALAWVSARLLRRTLEARRATAYEAVRFGAEALKRSFFPLIGALFVWIARAIAGRFIHTSLLDLALVPLVGIGIIFIVFFFARRAFGRDGQTHTWLTFVERVVTLVVWVGMVLTVLGIQGAVLDWMAGVSFRIANTHVTLLSLLTGLLWVCVTMVVAMWLGASFEERVMRSGTLDANLKIVLARAGRALFVLAAVLISLSLVGIDITVLGVFGGALGVGLGFGLQKIASNYVSGFIILLDRSLRIGDAITVGGLQGRVTQIRTRYTVVRGLDGIETLVPNERLITDVVQNQSSFMTRGLLRVPVTVAYATDVEQVIALLVQAATGVDRVLQEPAPNPLLMSFGPDGINFELVYWVADAATGTGGVRSAVNRNIWRLFAAHGIAIPYAQREIRMVGAGTGDAGSATTAPTANEPGTPRDTV